MIPISESEVPEAESGASLYKEWDDRITKSEKYLEKATTHGRAVYNRYQDERDQSAAGNARLKKVNLFYSNVNTIKESLFNSLPKPDVSRLHKEDFNDDVARVASLIMQRGLNYEVQCAVAFKSAIEHAILDRLVPGLGQVWVRFDMKIDPQTQQPLPGTEAIYVDTVYWEDFIYEPTRTWEQVTWVARKLELTKSEMVRRWGATKADKVEAYESKSSITPKQVVQDKFCVYEIWDKTTSQVIHHARGVEEPLDMKEDPYKLRGFFPCPCPLIANPTTTSFLPVTDYHIAQDQYGQLDVLYARMGLIVDAIKVAGVYDASKKEIGRMLEGQENKLIPVDDWAMLAESGGPDGVIGWYPVEKCIIVLQQLQQQFEAVKAMLQEISGMADIMRGGSNQYETAKAQQIKAQFASVRMNGYQRNVAEFVTDILKIMAELMTQLYSDDKMQKIVGNLLPADMEHVPEAMAVLRDDFMSMYKVTISADSLTQSDWALEKGQRMELMGFISQFLQSVVPAMKDTPQLGPLLLTMLKFTIAGFKGAAEVEGVIDQQLDQLVQEAQNPKPPEPSPEQQKMQAEQQMAQQQMQMDQQKMQMEFQLKQQEAEHRMQLEQQQAQADMVVERQKAELEAQLQQQKMASEERLQQQELAFLNAKLQMEMDFKAQEHAMKMSVAQQQADIKTNAAHEAAELKAGEKENGNGKD